MPSSKPLHPVGKLFSVVALIEAFTWAGLLFGMVLKYGPQANAAVVSWFGPLHGIAFLVYLGVAIYTAWKLRWSPFHTLLAMLAAVPPLMTLPLEIWYRKKALLAAGRA